jgi:hypothetical protein
MLYLLLFILVIPGFSYAETTEPSLDLSIEKNETGFFPWNKEKAKKPPTYKPYSLPRFDSGDDRHFNRHVPALVRAPQVDGDLLFKSVINCYPATSLWKIDIDLRGRLQTDAGLQTTENGDLIGGSYVGIVGKMPLYSTTEMDRQRDREMRRRQATAKVIANFVSAIASRNHALREFGLYSSLEARSHLRVQQGIADVNEQIKYLEKVASSQEKLISDESKIMESRLILVGMCADDKSENMNIYLSQISKVPGVRKGDS